MTAVHEMKPRRLSKAARREQLLDTALTIVRDHGADALTLGLLAKEACISKPVVYEHFETRSGLLIALYRRLDALQVEALLDSLAQARGGIEEVVDLLARTYMTCHTINPEGSAVSAALMGDVQMGAVQQELLDGCVVIFIDALAPFSTLSPESLRQRCVGFVGAADALSRHMIQGMIDEAAATATLAAMITSGIEAR